MYTRGLDETGANKNFCFLFPSLYIRIFSDHLKVFCRSKIFRVLIELSWGTETEGIVAAVTNNKVLPPSDHWFFNIEYSRKQSNKHVCKYYMKRSVCTVDSNSKRVGKRMLGIIRWFQRLHLKKVILSQILHSLLGDAVIIPVNNYSLIRQLEISGCRINGIIGIHILKEMMISIINSNQLCCLVLALKIHIMAKLNTRAFRSKKALKTQFSYAAAVHRVALKVYTEKNQRIVPFQREAHRGISLITAFFFSCFFFFSDGPYHLLHTTFKKKKAQNNNTSGMMENMNNTLEREFQ